MGCVSESELQRFVEGTLPPPAANSVEEHLASCDACRELLAEAVREVDEAPAPPEGAPRRFGRYEIERAVGAGGMGVVYAARDAQLDRRVALKVLRPSALRAAPEAHALLLREARAMARLSHPNVLAVFDVGELDGRVFLAMEWIEGQTLTAWLRERARAWTEVADAFVAAARGLQAAHEAGLVHRDFKPDNALVDAQGRIRVTDFGLALPASETAGPSGTPLYMAPEQRRGEPADARADVYSFCVALHEAVAGERPREGRCSPCVPQPLRALLERGLSPDPSRRFPSAAELRAALEAARRRSARAPWTAAAVGALLVVATLASVLLLQRRELRTLAERKDQLDKSLAAVLAQMQAESSPQRLRELELRVEALSGGAQEAAQTLGARGQSATRDALDAHIAELLHRFGADTYAVPPVFKETLRRHIAELLRSPGLARGRARMAEWLPSVQRELSAQRLPPELAYLAYAESAFDPTARSTQGAFGLWQFMDFTARRYGLRVDAESDERADVLASTHAAARYLRDLLADFGPEQFLLAIASYNMGETQMRRVLRALAEEPGGLERTRRDFWHLYRRKLLPDETRNYVPAVLAAAVVFTHPREYGLE
jgi:serine/threonine-protein kinase